MNASVMPHLSNHCPDAQWDEEDRKELDTWYAISVAVDWFLALEVVQ